MTILRALLNSHQAGLVLVILLTSSELLEILNLSTRVLVIRDGRLAEELSDEETDQDRVMRLMTGV
ncbi:uncharacterized protein METZ01_LOCUS112509 [marine metagenome]|uniref:Uncharacterized protein n=1 Tax=marine metagenome TaxID=408172 RepID=A0A381X4H9_9ZZZZ